MRAARCPAPVGRWQHRPLTWGAAASRQPGGPATSPCFTSHHGGERAAAGLGSAVREPPAAVVWLSRQLDIAASHRAAAGGKKSPEATGSCEETLRGLPLAERAGSRGGGFAVLSAKAGAVSHPRWQPRRPVTRPARPGAAGRPAGRPSPSSLGRHSTAGPGGADRAETVQLSAKWVFWPSVIQMASKKEQSSAS